MHVGETYLTTKPRLLIGGENGQFRVVAPSGRVEWYFCSEHQIKLIRRDGKDETVSVPSGQFLVEKLSAAWY